MTTSNEAPTLGGWADAALTDKFHPYPLLTFQEHVLSLCDYFGLRRILEIGGGRTPLFPPDELADRGLEYYVNDISQEELDAAPSAIPADRKVCFDISAPRVATRESYDLVYSKSVFEHVTDGVQAWRNSYALLRPGGIAFHYFPTLYCVPFVANRLLPERLSQILLERVVGNDYKKFPAKYDHCRSTVRVTRAIESIGFSSVFLIPFWGHDYFERIKPLNALDTRLHRAAAAREFRAYSSYCYGLARR